MKVEKPIRILRIIARLNVGGPAIQAVSLSANLSKDLFRTLLVCGSVSPDEGDMSYLAGEHGVEPYILPQLGRAISMTDDIRSFMALRKIIRRFRPHIIHTHTAKSGTLGRLAAVSLNLARGSRERIKLVHTFHGHVFHSYFGSLKTSLFIRIERFLARFTDRIVVISPRQQKDICQKFRIAGKEKVRVIPLGFDLSHFSGSENHRKDIREKFLSFQPQDTLLVGIIGRLTHVKNHRMLLDAAKCLKEKKADAYFKFLIIGDGELKEELMQYSDEIGVKDSFVFTGWQRSMPSVYSAIDIVALTSLNEGTPVSLIEAMASQKPVVATDVGGVGDLMGAVEGRDTDGFTIARNGILIPSKRGDILARALLFLLENKEASKKRVKNAREFVLNEFTLEGLVNNIEFLYNELLPFHKLPPPTLALPRRGGGDLWY